MKIVCVSDMAEKNPLVSGWGGPLFAKVGEEDDGRLLNFWLK